MTVTYIARTPGTPNTVPPSQIAGILGGANPPLISAFDVWNGVNADIAPIVNPFGATYQYRVVWNMRIRITSAVPNNISAFFGNPQRRYLGQLTFGTFDANSESLPINYINSEFPTHKFLYTNTRGRILNRTDIPSGAATSFSSLVSTDLVAISNLVTPFAPTGYDYADFARWALFPGLTFNYAIAYSALALISDVNNFADIGIPV